MRAPRILGLRTTHAYEGGAVRVNHIVKAPWVYHPGVVTLVKSNGKTHKRA
jgi:hypothetical protein